MNGVLENIGVSEQWIFEIMKSRMRMRMNSIEKVTSSY